MTTCPRCGGRGEIIPTPSSVCHGTRVTEQHRHLKVDVPAGCG